MKDVEGTDKQKDLYGNTVKEFFSGVKNEDFKRYVKLKDEKLHRLKFSKKPPTRTQGDYGARLEYEVIENKTSKILTTSPYMIGMFLKYLDKQDLDETAIGGKTFNIKRTGKRDNTVYTFELIK